MYNDIKKGVKVLKAQEDAELVVRQVKNQYLVKKSRLRNYLNKVWDEIESLDALSIISVPREFNSRANSLAFSASLLLPHPNFKDQIYKVEVIFRPNVLDNDDSWHVFDDDKNIQEFIEGPESFVGLYFEGITNSSSDPFTDGKRKLQPDMI